MISKIMFVDEGEHGGRRSFLKLIPVQVIVVADRVISLTG